MFCEGVVKTYNEDRGFGFIKVENQQKDIFFHIKDFPNKNIQPKIGERLKFRIANDHNGKAKAENIVRLDVYVEERQNINSSVAYSKRQTNRKKQQPKTFNFLNFILGFVIIAVFLAVFIPFVTGIYKRETLKRQVAEPMAMVSKTTDSTTNSNFRCDGRKHCSEMSSRDEAVYFINNCPGTLMDGDGDGDPCEGQFR